MADNSVGLGELWLGYGLDGWQWGWAWRVGVRVRAGWLAVGVLAAEGYWARVWDVAVINWNLVIISNV